MKTIIHLIFNANCIMLYSFNVMLNVCVCVCACKGHSPLHVTSGVLAGTQHFIMEPFGLEQIRILYKYVEETNSSLINASLYSNDTFQSVMVCVYGC